MAKKKKKRKPFLTKKTASTADPEVILQRAEEQFKQGHVRRAQEGFRRLYRMDPNTYSERYVQVTGAAITEILSEGRLGEAAKLIRNLHDVGSVPDEIRLQELRIARMTGKWEQAVEAARDLLENQSDAFRIEAADVLVLARAQEAEPIADAIEAIELSEWEMCSEELRALARKSPFAHWRLFLRGVMAFYQGQEQEMRRCFSRLPENSIPAKKSAAFEFMLGNWQNVGSAAVQGACVLNRQEALSRTLPQCQKSWVAGDYKRALRFLRKERKRFPSLEVSPWGELTKFVRLFHNSMDEEGIFEWMTALMDAFLFSSATDSRASYVAGSSLANFTDGGAFMDQEMEAFWSGFLVARREMLGANPRFEAHAYMMRAADWTPHTCGNPSCDCWRNHADDKHWDQAIEFLKKSIAADPTFEPPHTELVGIYRTLRRTKEANRMLDQMTKSFPESKSVLLQAGCAALDRKAHVKGLKYLKQAKAIDPIDEEILAEIRRGLEQKAVEHFRKAQTAKARETFQSLLGQIPADPKAGQAEPYVLLRWAAAEEAAFLLRGDSDSLAEQKRSEGAENLPSQVAEFYFTTQLKILAKRFRVGLSQKSALPRTIRKKDPSQADEMLQLMIRMVDDGDLDMEDCICDWLERYLRQTVTHFKREHRELAQSILHSAPEEWEHVKNGLINRFLKFDRDDPWFTAYSWIHGLSYRPDPELIQSVQDTAKQRGDQEALSFIDHYEKNVAREQELIKRLGFSFESDDDDDDDDFDDEEWKPPDRTTFVPPASGARPRGASGRGASPVQLDLPF